MMQCFLPQRPISAREYDTRHGRAALSVEAGRLGNRDVIGEFIYCDVPSGAKPRLILPYIIGEAVRTNNPEIDLGRSLRAFMAKIGVPIAGTNGKALTAQIQNIATAEIIIAVWADDQMHTEGGRFARKLSFWLERDSNQQSFWTPSMTLSAEFYDAIQAHRVPIDAGHLAKLARSPRRMDLYTWLSHRRWARSGIVTTTPWRRASSPLWSASCSTEPGSMIIAKHRGQSSSSSKDGIPAPSSPGTGLLLTHGLREVLPGRCMKPKTSTVH